MKKKVPKLISDFYGLKVEQVMDKKIWDIPLIEISAPIINVLSILDGKSHVWVVKDRKSKELVGVITRQDVLGILSPPRTSYNVFSIPRYQHHGTQGKAEDVMKEDPVTTRADEKIVDILQKMIKHRCRWLPVVSKDNKLQGEITLKHLIHKYYLATQYIPITDD